MRDFDLLTYTTLIDELKNKEYKFSPFNLFRQLNNSKGAILRHDVDRLPENSAIMADLENSRGIKGTYNFRIVPESFDEKVITKIATLGHEIGYHYEEMDTVYKAKVKGQKSIRRRGSTFREEDLVNEAYDLFCINLAKIRKIADVKTICMHGSPLSPFDNKAIWKKYNYRELGLIGEPYFDLDFNEFAYLTDTGRRWDGGNVSVRDKVESKACPDGKSGFKSTHDIINNIEKLPGKIMFTIHPQRWNDNIILWTKELILQNMKNVVKKIIVRNQVKR